jgi:hypothetical protein
MGQLRAALTIPLLMLLANPIPLPAMTVAVTYPIKAKGSDPFWRIQRKGLWGFMDRSGFIDKLGRIAIGFKFAEVTPFSGGVATVREPVFDKYGVIDTKGNTVRPFDLTSAGGFKEGFAGAADAAGAGLIGPDGRFRFQLPNAREVESPAESVAQASALRASSAPGLEMRVLNEADDVAKGIGNRCDLDTATHLSYGLTCSSATIYQVRVGLGDV